MLKTVWMKLSENYFIKPQQVYIGFTSFSLVSIYNYIIPDYYIIYYTQMTESINLDLKIIRYYTVILFWVDNVIINYTRLRLHWFL